MKGLLVAAGLAVVSACIATNTLASSSYNEQKLNKFSGVELGPRPFFLVDGMEEGELKEKLESCKNKQFYKTKFSIGHRGAPAQFPEHTLESYTAGAHMGAGILECDVTFTADYHPPPLRPSKYK